METRSKLVDDFVSLSLKARDASKAAKKAKEDLIECLEKEGIAVGCVSGDNHSVEVGSKISRKWDSQSIEAVYGAVLPEFIKRTLSISNSVYESLPEEDKKQLDGCYLQEKNVTLKIIS